MDYSEFIKKGLLKEEKIDFAQINKVVEKAERSLKSAGILVKNSDSEGGFQLAYEAMLLSGRALVFSYGLRPRAAGSHKIVIDFCELALSDSYKALTYKFDKMRKQRNYLIYGLNLSLSDIEAENAIKTAGQFIEKIKEVVGQKDSRQKLI